MSYTKRIISGFGVIFLCAALGNVFAYLLRLLLARTFTPSEYGLIYAVIALFGFVAFLSTLGLHDALTNTLPKLKPAQQKSALLMVLAVQFTATLLCALTAMLLAPWLAAHYFHDPAAATLVMIYAIVFFFSPIELTMAAFFQGMGKVSWFGYFSLTRTAALLLFVPLLIKLGYGMNGVLIGYVLMCFLLLILSTVMLYKVMPNFAQLRARFDPVMLRQLFGFGLPVMLSSTMGILLIYIDVFFITLYRSLAEVGLYNVALPTASLLWFISGVLYAVMFPISSEMNAKKDLRYLQAGISSIYSYVFVLIVPFTLLQIFFPGIIINTLFGIKYVAAARTMQLLVIGGFFYTYFTVNSALMNGAGHPRRMTLILGIGAALNVLLDILLIPKYGIEGSAIATLIAFLIMFIMSTVSLYRIMPFSLKWRTMFATMVAACVFIGIIMVSRLLDLPQWWKMGIGVVVGGIAYVLLLFLLRVLNLQELKSMIR